MTESSRSEILSLLAEPEIAAGIPDLVDEHDSDDVSAVLSESIKKAQESNNREFAPEEDALVDSFFASESGPGDNWEFMKAALLDALNTPYSGSGKSPGSHPDEEMHMEREGGGEKSEAEEPRDNVFENWNVESSGVWDLEDVSESFDVEIGLVKDLKELLSNGIDTGTDTGAVAGTTVGEWNSESINVDELVAELGKLFIESS